MKIGDKVKVIGGVDLYHKFPKDSIVKITNVDKDIVECEGTTINGDMQKQVIQFNCLEEVPLKASTIVEYYKIYKTYLFEHGLQDNTDSITVDQLVDFVENHLYNP